MDFDMKFTIPIKIECGEKTCAAEPGKFCNMLTLNVTGGGTCHLFGRVFDERDGGGVWIIRHHLCLEHAKKIDN
jgi:hypothetical protein